MTDPLAPRHRGLFWTAALLGLAAVVVGATVAIVSYAATSGPDGAVRGYFSALARGDAAAALGFGDLPAGDHALLTATVLRDQQRIAHMSDIGVISVERHGSVATVAVQYRLAFARGTQQAVDQVEVVRRNGTWRLLRTAVATRLRLKEGSARATIRGGAIPDGPVLIFPGAVPISFDTPYLQLAPDTAGVRLDAPTDSFIDVEVSTAGHDAIVAALRTSFAACLGAHADPTCPLPSPRAVPGSIRAHTSPDALDHVSLAVTPDSSTGTILVTGADVAATGHYVQLDFNQQPVTKSGSIPLPIDAHVYPVDPVVIRWITP